MPGGQTHAPTTKRRGGKGRPSSLTEETLQVIERTLLNLGSYEDAAVSAGIHPRTFERWRERGERESADGKANDYTEFYHRVEKANWKIKTILRGRLLSTRDPKMALKILERRWPKEWGLKQQIDVKDVTPPKKSPRERLIERLAAIEERQAKALDALHALGIDADQPT